MSAGELGKHIVIGVVVGAVAGIGVGLVGGSLNLSPGVRGAITGTVVVLALSMTRRLLSAKKSE